MRQLKIVPSLSGFVSTLATAGLTGIGYWLSLRFGVAYGWTSFCLIPVVLGFISSLLLTPKAEFAFDECFTAMSWALLFVAIGFLVFAIEGFMCLLMAVPIVFPLALLGSALGYWLRRYLRNRRRQSISCAAAVLMIPVAVGIESHTPPKFVEHQETSELIINASPERVWSQLTALRTLPSPQEWIFKVGVAYPMSIECNEPWVGGVRLIRLSTGLMRQQIEVFRPNRELQFKVLSTPDSMKETSPWGSIHPPHLSSYFISERGRIELQPLPGGRTRIVGTSWYASRLAPDPYWSLWTDSVVEEVHLRLFREIKRQKERGARPAPGSAGS